MKALDIIISYVEGKVSPHFFEQALYNNNEMEELLSENISIPPYTNEGSIFLYLLSEKLTSQGGHLNSVDVLSKYLDLKNTPYVLDTTPADAYALILRVQPNWLDIPDDYWSRLLGKFKDKKGKELESLLKEQIKHEFRFLTKKPSWLQAPAWPIVNSRPLLFIGQCDISKIRHDMAYAYLFFDENENKYVTIEQSM